MYVCMMINESIDSTFYHNPLAFVTTTIFYQSITRVTVQFIKFCLRIDGDGVLISLYAGHSRQGRHVIYTIICNWKCIMHGCSL